MQLLRRYALRFCSFSMVFHAFAAWRCQSTMGYTGSEMIYRNDLVAACYHLVKGIWRFHRRRLGLPQKVLCMSLLSGMQLSQQCQWQELQVRRPPVFLFFFQDGLRIQDRVQTSQAHACIHVLFPPQTCLKLGMRSIFLFSDSFPQHYRKALGCCFGQPPAAKNPEGCGVRFLICTSYPIWSSNRIDE